jgi:asparagine N-glycosylation enzyme membrane subunit Stt3
VVLVVVVAAALVEGFAVFATLESLRLGAEGLSVADGWLYYISIGALVCLGLAGFSFWVACRANPKRVVAVVATIAALVLPAAGVSIGWAAGIPIARSNLIVDLATLAGKLPSELCQSSESADPDQTQDSDACQLDESAIAELAGDASAAVEAVLRLAGVAS